jgi:hypothetical protein
LDEDLRPRNSLRWNGFHLLGPDRSGISKMETIRHS